MEGTLPELLTKAEVEALHPGTAFDIIYAAEQSHQLLVVEAEQIDVELFLSKRRQFQP